MDDPSPVAPDFNAREADGLSNSSAPSFHLRGQKGTLTDEQLEDDRTLSDYNIQSESLGD